MLLTNQENNFIDKKLKDQTKKPITNAKVISSNMNKSSSLHKSNDKTNSKGG